MSDSCKRAKVEPPRTPAKGIECTSANLFWLSRALKKWPSWFHPFDVIKDAIAEIQDMWSYCKHVGIATTGIPNKILTADDMVAWHTYDLVGLCNPFPEVDLPTTDLDTSTPSSPSTPEVADLTELSDSDVD